MRRISPSQPPLRGFAGRGVARSVQVLQAVLRRGPAVRVLAEPARDPLLDLAGLQIRRHVAGLVHRVHEGDARLDVHLVALGAAAHGQREGQAPEVVRRGQLAAPCAFGRLGQLIRRPERLGVVDAHGDDAVVGQPAVADGLEIALAVQFHAEGGLVVHRAHDPVWVAGGPLAVVNARRGGLIDAVGDGEHGVVMADGEVAQLLFLLAGCGGLRVPALQSRGPVSFVRNHHLTSDASLQQGFRHPSAALVGAD